MRPPRAKKTAAKSFPHKETRPLPDKAAQGELSVLRFAPEGEVAMAPHLSVTFSHPMVTVTSQTEAAKTVPVSLEPMPRGRWRWLGTKTLMFDPKKRFPMATDYRVKIPAGTQSALGKRLKKPHSAVRNVSSTICSCVKCSSSASKIASRMYWGRSVTCTA